MTTSLFLLSLATYFATGWAFLFHFSHSNIPIQTYLFSSLSSINYFVFLYYLFQEPHTPVLLSVAALLLFVGAFALFFSAIWSSREKKLGLSFDYDAPTFELVTSGVFKYIRHPFYFSYILFYLACGLSSRSTINIMFFAAASTLLCVEAINEEKRLKASENGDRYLEYINTTWRFVPGLW